MNNIPEWLYFWIARALLGEIYPSIRAIAVGFDERRCLTLRYYLDREVSESDYENMDVVFANIFANTSSNNDIKEARNEIFFNLKPVKDLDVLNGLVYLRKE